MVTTSLGKQTKWESKSLGFICGSVVTWQCSTSSSKLSELPTALQNNYHYYY